MPIFFGGDRDLLEESEGAVRVQGVGDVREMFAARLGRQVSPDRRALKGAGDPEGLRWGPLCVHL